MIDISTLIDRGGVYFNLEGNNSPEVLTSLINMSSLPTSVNRETLRKAVLERESLMPTALGNGIAIPHPRNCVLTDPSEERIVVGYPRHPVDYQALDKEPVSALFLILSADQRSHLQILSQLSFIFHDQDFRKLLATKPKKEELEAAVKKLLGK